MENQAANQEAKKPEFSKALLEKYEPQPGRVQPSKMDFGHKYGNITCDLTQDSSIVAVERLVREYPSNPYFKAKPGTEAAKAPKSALKEDDKK